MIKLAALLASSLAFAKANSAVIKPAALAVAAGLGLLLGACLPTVHARLIAEAVLMGVAAVAGKEYLP